MSELLKIRHLRKSFQGRTAVDDLSFDVQKGEILCLLGPNGAGKSTTIHMIGGIYPYVKDTLFYEGKSLDTVRKKFLREIGFVPQEISLYEDLSARENVRFFASLYGLRKELLKQRVEEALEFAGLQDRGDEKVKHFSGGMKRRLNIACAIAHHPKLVIMDEPTVGIDPQSRNHILSSIKRLRDEGMTILYTTHYMEEVEEISTRIIIMDHGKLIAQGTKEELKEGLEAKRSYIMEVEELQPDCMDAFYAIEGVQEVVQKDSQLCISTLKNVENLDEIIRTAMRRKLVIRNLYCESINLETVFLELTGRRLRD